MSVERRPNNSGVGDIYGPERRRLIEEFVEVEGRASVRDLAEQLGVSLVTIRKDLSILEGEQRLERAHGGAIATQRTRAEAAFDVRDRMRREEKGAIAASAAALVYAGESVALDASTTALHVARQLRSFAELTVLTNSLYVASELASARGITVFMPGGRVRWEAFSLAGLPSASSMPSLNIHKAFMGAVGLTLEQGLTELTEEEAAMKRAMIAGAREVVAILDHTKWGRVGAATFCPTGKIHRVITSLGAPPELVESLRNRGVIVDEVDPLPIDRRDRARTRPRKPA